MLAAYEAWVASEWAELQPILEAARTDERIAPRLARAVIGHHRKWAGLRRSLRAAAATDDTVRDFQLSQRQAQLGWLSSLRGGKANRARNFSLLLELERVCDAIAEGDAKRLGISNAEMVREVERVIAGYLE